MQYQHDDANMMITTTRVGVACSRAAELPLVAPYGLFYLISTFIQVFHEIKVRCQSAKTYLLLTGLAICAMMAGMLYPSSSPDLPVHDHSYTLKRSWEFGTSEAQVYRYILTLHAKFRPRTKNNMARWAD